MTRRLPCPALRGGALAAALPCPALGGAALAAALPCPDLRAAEEKEQGAALPCPVAPPESTWTSPEIFPTMSALVLLN